MDKDLVYYLGFSHFLGIGPIKFAALVSHFKNVKKAYLADKKELQEIIGITWAEKFNQFRNHFNPEEKLRELKRKEIQTIPVGHELYPKSIESISDPPICLYVKGEIKNFNFVKEFFIAIVGTRKPTPYGQQIARKFAEELTRAGFVIVSGMAIGIDTAAHKTCLAAEGKTIAVLGCGVDIVYPASNYNLYRLIIDKGGLIISEFPPGQLVAKGLFIARNRLISALSLGVVVVEGGKDSGALITARYAAEQGKEVFAPPSPLTWEMSAAPNSLLKQGAKLVTSIEDILEEFNLKIVPKKKKEIEEELDGTEKNIFQILQSEPKLGDEIAYKTALPIEQVLNTLSMLEIKGIVEKNSEGKYQIKL